MDVIDFERALVFTGGGTGGHLFPAMALAEGARERWPGRPIIFVGARRGIEARRLPESPWPHLLLEVEGFLGRSPLAILRASMSLLRARRDLIRRWRGARPWAVVGTGGYAAAPALLAARALKIPYFLHESNAAPGALVKLVAGRARRVWCGMEALRPMLPKADCLVVGTPVRASFRRDFRPMETLCPPYGLLVMGGSAGARALNEAVLESAPGLLEAHPDWTILHQAGPAEAERLASAPLHPRHRLVPFLDRPDEALEASSLVLSRAGASTCAELAACGRPAVLVPFPQAAGDHQTLNARAMEAAGRAVLMVQGPDLARRLEARLTSLFADPATRKALARLERNSAVEQCLADLQALAGP